MEFSSIFDCKIVPLNKISNKESSITVIESNINISFDVKRIYYLYDVPIGEKRGGHAHKNLYQLITAAVGSYSVILDDGKQKKTVRLDRPDIGLLIVPGIWRELLDFSSGAISLVLASEIYSEADYIRDYMEFKIVKNGYTNS